jgi:uncharacterized membrane protein YqaE (UPF0057 family)
MVRTLAFLWLLLASNPPAVQSLGRNDTLILAAPDDPYYALAEEMAQKETLPIGHSLDEALAQNPVFILWVVSPGFLSDHIMVDFGRALRNRPSAVALGIISGKTLDDARALWLRAPDVEGDRVFAANALNPAGNIEAELIEFGEEDTAVQPLSKANLLRSLEVADYLTFSGHGGSSYLRLGENSRLQSGQIPPLPPSVIATSSCNTFRLWDQNSLALDMARQGAAAYAGFVFSPNSGYLIGAYGDVPFRYTWPDFPIGHAIQVQNHGTLQGFAQLPYYWLLGDPRIALQAEAPYHLTSTESTNGTLTLSYDSAPTGIIPVHIPGGAQYRFVELPGVSAAWDLDPFYNAWLQTVNIGDDKFILFEHRGGGFTLQLHSHPSWLWVAGDVLADSLDTTYLFFPEHGSDLIMLVVGILLWPVAWLVLRKKGSSRTLVPALLTGLGFAIIQGLYALARLERLTITSKIVGFKPLSLVSTFLLVSCGVFLFLNVRSWRGRAVAVLVATLSALLPAIGNFSLFLVANSLVSRASLGTGLWNTSLATQPLIVFAFECVLFSLVFWTLSRIVQPGVKETRNA